MEKNGGQERGYDVLKVRTRTWWEEGNKTVRYVREFLDGHRILPSEPTFSGERTFSFQNRGFFLVSPLIFSK